MKELKYVVRNEGGLHAAPVGMLAWKANEFESAIRIGKGERVVDAKRILGIIGLRVKKGEEIYLTAEGTDEEHAINEIGSLFRDHL